MKKEGVLNDKISALIAEMGHKERMMICDAGMPIPLQCNRIDIALTAGIPRFLDTLNAVLRELKVEGIILSEEIREYNANIDNAVREIFRNTDIEIEYISHEEMKKDLLHTKGVVRTGEFSPFANIQLISGVVF